MRKPGPPREMPPPLELECLKVLWDLGKGSVKEVHEALAKNDRQLAYTTVLTVLDRLANRAAVERHKVGRAFVYVPKLDLDRARRTALRELVTTYFSGSYNLLRDYLASPGVEDVPSAELAAEAAAEQVFDDLPPEEPVIEMEEEEPREVSSRIDTTLL